jgi:DNA-binding transcriptional MerR regulator
LKRTHTIGAVAQLTGVSADTIRFYERKGVLPKAPRNQSGYRVYPPELIERIGFLKRARGLGFSLNRSRHCC